MLQSREFKAKRVVASGEAIVGHLVLPSCAKTSLMFLKFLLQTNDLQKFRKLVRFKFEK